MRNEVTRLPFFLDHHRALGVDHFYIVDNNSNDGTHDFLNAQKDVSLFFTDQSYKSSRFGMDWLTLLHLRYARGRWALTLDADECLVLPGGSNSNLKSLTTYLRAQKIPSFGALMLDLYPQSALGTVAYKPGQAFWDVASQFDPSGYIWEFQRRYGNISIKGGPRARVFFANEPSYAPHLHKIPLVDWRRSYAYVSSTHVALPRNLNTAFDARLNRPTGALLHAKFLPEVVNKSREEKLRQEHFTHPERYELYYDRITDALDLSDASSVTYEGTDQLEALGLIQRGSWTG
ncbi:MAG: glycosyltransferase family 2 protein [Pseudomonadota bacterium]